jgi:hypothetical protein
VITTHKVVVLIDCLAVLLAAPAFAQGVPAARSNFIPTTAERNLASAYDGKTPMVTSEHGSRLTTADESSDRYRNRLKSLGHRRSNDYVRSTDVAPAPADAKRLNQEKVPVSDEPLETRWTYRSLRADIRRRFEQSSRLTPPVRDASYRRWIETIDEPVSAMKQDMTGDGFQISVERRFRY